MINNPLVLMYSCTRRKKKFRAKERKGVGFLLRVYKILLCTLYYFARFFHFMLYISYPLRYIIYLCTPRFAGEFDLPRSNPSELVQIN